MSSHPELLTLHFIILALLCIAFSVEVVLTYNDCFVFYSSDARF